MKKITTIILLVCSTHVGLSQMYISSGAELTSIGKDIYSNENVVNHGKITFTSTGDLILDAGLDNSATSAELSLADARLVIGSGGANAASTDDFKFKDRNTSLLGDQVKHLVLNKTTGTANVTVGHLGVSETFESIDGTLNGSSTVTLLNRADGAYAQVKTSVGGAVNLEVERFIPSRRAFRLVSPSVTSTESINAQWQEGASEYTEDLVPGFGTHITGFGTENTTPVVTNQDGFDWNPSGNPSLFPYDNAEQEWVSAGVANTDSEVLSYNTPLRLFVRGNRTTNITSNSAASSETILRTRGELKVGQHVVTGLSTGADDFNFVANPYASRVDFTKATKTNLTNFIYVWDASLGVRGGFATVDLGNNTPDPSDSNANAIIMPGQAFFVRNTATGNPNITFEETHKAITENHTAIFSEQAYLNLSLQAINGSEIVKLDGVGIRFNDAYSNEVDDSDARKLWNPDENFLIIKDGAFLAIEKRPMPLAEETLPLGLIRHRYQSYQFVPRFNFLDANVKVYLKDNYLETQQELVNNESISFQVDANLPESVSAYRFELVFSPVTLHNDTFDEVTFSMYPNPASTSVSIALPQSSSAKEWEVVLYDITGKKIQASSVAPNNRLHNVDVSSLPSGVYLIKIGNDQHSSTQKLIKK